MTIYASFFKGVIELGIECLGFVAHPDVDDEMLKFTSAAFVQIQGKASARYTCTGCDIEDNGITLEIGEKMLVEGTENVIGFLAREGDKENDTDKCELHFELMR